MLNEQKEGIWNLTPLLFLFTIFTKPFEDIQAEELDLRFSGLEKALSQALEAAQGPGASAEENACKLSVEEIAAIPAEFAQDTVRRIHDAAEMGDIMTLNAIAEEIKMHSDSCAPIGKQIVQLAEDFDFDGVQNLAHLLDT